MHHGIACLASQASDWAVALWEGLSGLSVVILFVQNSNFYRKKFKYNGCDHIDFTKYTSKVAVIV